MLSRRYTTIGVVLMIAASFVLYTMYMVTELPVMINLAKVSSNAFARGDNADDKNGTSWNLTSQSAVPLENSADDEMSSSSFFENNAAQNATVMQQKLGEVDDFRFCRATNSTAPKFYCSGPQYEAFADTLERFVLDNRHPKYPLWGRRPSPAPANTTILLIGNSHTRQLFNSLACQYRDRTVSMEMEEPTAPLGTLTVQADTTSTVRIHCISNHWMVYLSNWPSILIQTLNLTSMDDIDAIVLGRFNDKSNSKGTTFETWIEEQLTLFALRNDTMAETAPLGTANATTNSSFLSTRLPPPMVSDVAAQYKGPMVVAGMFAAYAERDFKKQKQQVRELAEKHNRTNIALVHGRTFIQKLGECSTDGPGRGNCLMEPNDTNKQRRKAKDMHRCFGHRGGHPSLIAWDVVEELYKLLL